MSELRELEIPIDLDMLEGVARECGFSTSRGVTIKGFSTHNLMGELVIHTEKEEIGVHNGKLVYDNWHGSCEKALKKIMPRYMDKYVTKRLGRKLVHKKEDANQVIYLVN